MKKVIITSLIILIVVGMGVIFAGNGNGAPSGPHYNLNIIGVPHRLNENFDGGNGSRIFVLRTGSTQFYVHGEEGGSYQVLDHDGTDGKVGEDRLNPGIIFPYDSTASPTWRVHIWVRLQGPVDSSLHWYVEKFDGSNYVFYDEFTLKKEAPSKFTEKTGSLLADGYQDMLWTLDQKTKFRICQMRIYLLDE